MRFKTLAEWLNWQETLHPSSIDLGLDRVRVVLERMGLAAPAYRIVTVAGTNGKGSSVAMLASILQQAGYKVATYTSPHLLRYNERIRVHGAEAGDASICQAFENIDNARGDISLTYFEFGTLAAIDIFSRADIDVAVLEVGLGGRLDAVNVMDADVALVTALDVDHSNWLGEDRETIAMEKAGILRSNRPAVFSDRDVPVRVLEHARELHCDIYRIGHEYDYHYSGSGSNSWAWKGPGTMRPSLNLPALRGDYQLQNAAGVLMVLQLLEAYLPVNQQSVRAGFADIALAGRFQVLPGRPLQVLDVAHNPQAAAVLSRSLKTQTCVGKTYAVVAMLQDKNILAVLEHLFEFVDFWYVSDLLVPRGEKAVKLASILNDICSRQGKMPVVEQAQSVRQAYKLAMDHADEHDRIVVFGSFYTVAEVLQQAL